MSFAAASYGKAPMPTNRHSNVELIASTVSIVRNFRPAALLLLKPVSSASLTYFEFIIGSISLTIVTAAGPTRTIKIAGKMKSTSGKISFTAVFAAFSSAS